jgi:hypothetical protein
MATSIYDIPIDVNTVEEAEELPSLTYKLDLDTGRIVGKVDGLQAVNQAIRKAILTPRFKCLAYDNQYGSEIKEEIIASNATPALIQTAIPKFIEDCLKPDTRILRVYDFEISTSDDECRIYFKADTIFGETEFEEVI